MIAFLLGTLIGEHIDQEDGEDGATGALLGVATVAVLRRIIPLAIVGAGILVAKHYIEKAQAEA
jgi:hypothetical protein